jgi:hypothetical protein
MTDFYLVITKLPESFPSRFDQGTFDHGFWYAEKLESKIVMDEKIIYNVGISSDRKSPQYTISFSKENVCIESEKFGLSPLFYSHLNGVIYISSNIKLLAERIMIKFDLKICKRFLLEQNLFNYSLFNNTIFEEIKLCPANCKIIIADRLNIEETFKIEDHFVLKPTSYKNNIHRLVDLFIEITESKIKDGDYVSFTSGFDGRSLLALAVSQKLNIHTYSFGSKDSIDVVMPKWQAKELNIDFEPIFLDDAAYINSFAKLGEEILEFTCSNSNLLQLHWVYAAKNLKSMTNALVTGMFGSELFRSAHIAGQFISPALVDYFKHIESDRWIPLIRNSESLKFLTITFFDKEMDSLIDELSMYKIKILHLSKSQRFYKYIFDESFRKFFGLQFIQPMRQFVNVVNPYLDLEFIKELLKTDLAGVNNDFFTQNPLKRFKGQLFYAELIKKTSPNLFTLPTGKGYAPRDLLTFQGKFKISTSFVMGRLNRKIEDPDLDNLGILSGISTYNHSAIPNKLNTELYDKNYFRYIFNSNIWKKDEIARNKLIETLSTNLYLNNIYERNSNIN